MEFPSIPDILNAVTQPIQLFALGLLVFALIVYYVLKRDLNKQVKTDSDSKDDENKPTSESGPVTSNTLTVLKIFVVVFFTAAAGMIIIKALDLKDRGSYSFSFSVSDEATEKPLSMANINLVHDGEVTTLTTDKNGECNFDMKITEASSVAFFVNKDEYAAVSRYFNLTEDSIVQEVPLMSLKAYAASGLGKYNNTGKGIASTSLEFVSFPDLPGNNFVRLEVGGKGRLPDYTTLTKKATQSSRVLKNYLRNPRIWGDIRTPEIHTPGTGTLTPQIETTPSFETPTEIEGNLESTDTGLIQPGPQVVTSPPSHSTISPSRTGIKYFIDTTRVKFKKY